MPPTPTFDIGKKNRSIEGAGYQKTTVSSGGPSPPHKTCFTCWMAATPPVPNGKRTAPRAPNHRCRKHIAIMYGIVRPLLVYSAMDIKIDLTVYFFLSWHALDPSPPPRAPIYYVRYHRGKTQLKGIYPYIAICSSECVVTGNCTDAVGLNIQLDRVECRTLSHRKPNTINCLKTSKPAHILRSSYTGKHKDEGQTKNRRTPQSKDTLRHIL